MFARHLLQRQASNPSTRAASPLASPSYPSTPTLDDDVVLPDDPLDDSASISAHSASARSASISLRRAREDSEADVDQAAVEERRQRARTEVMKKYAREQAQQRMIPADDIEMFAEVL